MTEPQAVVPPTPTVEDQVKLYLELRRAIADAKAAYEKRIEKWVLAQELLTGWMQDFLDKTGADSVKTPFGTCYSSTKYSASLADPEAFMQHVIKTENYDLLDRKANVTAVKDYVATTGALPPGVNLSAIKTVGVRSPTRKA